MKTCEPRERVTRTGMPPKSTGLSCMAPAFVDHRAQVQDIQSLTGLINDSPQVTQMSSMLQQINNGHKKMSGSLFGSQTIQAMKRAGGGDDQEFEQEPVVKIGRFLVEQPQSDSDEDDLEQQEELDEEAEPELLEENELALDVENDEEEEITAVVNKVEFRNSHALTAHGGNDQVNPIWTDGALDHAASYTRNTDPPVTVTIPVEHFPEAAEDPKIRAKLGDGTELATADAIVQGTNLVADMSLVGMVGADQFGQSTQAIQWAVSADGEGFVAAGASGGHQIYWLLGAPQNTLFTTAVNLATASAGNDVDPATAIRIGLNAAVPYDATKLPTPDPQDVLLGGGRVCADFANALALLARCVGLAGSTVLYYGGVEENGIHVWIGTNPGGNTIENVQPGNHAFSYHAIGVIAGVEHDAALNRQGIAADAIHNGKQIYLTSLMNAAPASGVVGANYESWIYRNAHTVALQRNQTGLQITAGTFAGGVAYNIPVDNNPMFAAANWLITAGALPDGLALHNNLGKIFGTPLSAGTFNFTVTATVGVLNSSRDFSIKIT